MSDDEGPVTAGNHPEVGTDEWPTKVNVAFATMTTLRPPASVVASTGSGNAIPDMPTAERALMNAACGVLTRYLLGEEDYANGHPYAGRRRVPTRGQVVMVLRPGDLPPPPPQGQHAPAPQA